MSWVVVFFVLPWLLSEVGLLIDYCLLFEEIWCIIISKSRMVNLMSH